MLRCTGRAWPQADSGIVDDLPANRQYGHVSSVCVNGVLLAMQRRSQSSRPGLLTYFGLKPLQQLVQERRPCSVGRSFRPPCPATRVRAPPRQFVGDGLDQRPVRAANSLADHLPVSRSAFIMNSKATRPPDTSRASLDEIAARLPSSAQVAYWRISRRMPSWLEKLAVRAGPRPSGRRRSSS